MSAKIINTIIFSNLSGKSPWATAPYLFTYNNMLVCIWPIGVIIGIPNLCGLYILLIKENGTYCSFYSYDLNDIEINSGSRGSFNDVAVWIENNMIYASNLHTTINMDMPLFTTNGSVLKMETNYINNTIVNCPDFLSPQTGPYINFTEKIIAYDCTSTHGAPYGYGLIKGFDGKTISAHIYDNNSYSAIHSYSIKTTNLAENIHNGVMYITDSTGEKFYRSSVNIIYDNTDLCYNSLGNFASNSGVFNVIGNLTYDLTIPDVFAYSIGDSANPYIRIFSAFNGNSTNFFITCAALNINELYATSENINAISCAYLNGRAYFTVGNIIHVTGSSIPIVINIPDVSNSNGPPITSSSGNGDIQTKLLSSSKYLINFNRPISAIGAYKT